MALPSTRPFANVSPNSFVPGEGVIAGADGEDTITAGSDRLGGRSERDFIRLGGMGIADAAKCGDTEYEHGE